jgi:hypothetical protein
MINDCFPQIQIHLRRASALRHLHTQEHRRRSPEPEEVLDLKNLRVVAFVQNDKTKEVLQAKEVEVSGGKE